MSLADLDAIEQLHKDEMIGSYDTAVIDKENGKPHIVKRMDRPRIRIVPEIFGSGTLPRKELTSQPPRDSRRPGSWSSQHRSFCCAARIAPMPGHRRVAACGGTLGKSPGG